MWALRNIHVAVKERLPLSVIAHFFVYAAGKIAINGISIIMVPIMMILLSPADYGLLALINSFNNIAIACIGLGLPQVLMIEYFQTNEQSRPQVINSIILTYLIVNIPLLIVCSLYPHVIQGYLFLTQHHIAIVYAIILICIFSFLNDILFLILQYKRYAVAVTLIQLAVAIITALLNILCLGYYHYGIASIVWVQLFTILVVFGIGLFLYCRNVLYKAFIRSTLIKQCTQNLTLGIPLLPSMITCWLFALLNRWMMVKYAGLELAGIYAVADAGGQFIYRLVLQPLQGSYGTDLLSSYGDSGKNIADTERSNQHIMAFVLIAMLCILVIGYFLCKPIMYRIIPAGYVQAIDYLLIVLVGYLFLIGAYFVSNFIQFQKHRWIFVVSLALAVSINTALGIILIPLYGLTGCVIAATSGYGAYFFILLGYNRYLLKNY